MDLNTYIGVVTSLREEFFLFNRYQVTFSGHQAVHVPFVFPVDKAAAPAGGADRASALWGTEGKVQCSCSLSFSRDLFLHSNKFPYYIEHVKRIVAMFGNYYCYKQNFFSKMKYTKSHIRSQLRDCHFINDILPLSTSSTDPDIESLIHGKQHQLSH